MAEDKATKKGGETRIYEVGFHIVPMVAEEKLPEEVKEVKEIIRNASGEIIAEGTTESMELAYPLVIKTEGKKKTFDTAYFGWIKYEAPAGSVKKIQNALDLKETILRHIVIKTIRENTYIPPSERVSKEARLSPELEKDRSKVAQKEEKRDLTKEEEKNLDKTIEELVTD